jgi:hypothetical protein
MVEVRERVLQDDVNFRLEVADWHGMLAIKKSAKQTTPQTRIDRVKNDVYGMNFFAGLAKDNPQLKLYVPKIYASGDTYYVREYISDEPVVEEDTKPAEAAGRLDQLAKLLAGIDRIEPYGEVRFVGSSNYRRLHGSISEWSDENLRDGLISAAQAGRIKQISAGLGEFIRPRIAHGDMSPYKHSYIRPDGLIALIDFENFTPQAARYFDVAWSYTRLYSFAASANIPRQFLASFLSKAQPAKHQVEQLMAVLIQRTVAMQKDADVDLKNKGIDYRPRAKELLEIIMENKLELLHS